MRTFRKYAAVVVLGLAVAGGGVSINGCGSSPTGSCCRVCDDGQACGDACIDASETCNEGPGCACNG